LRWIDVQEDRDDITVFFFAGHGSSYRGHEYIVFSDGGYVSDNEFNTELSRLEGGMLIILDSCYSGGFIEEIGKNGRIVLTAVTKHQLGWQGGLIKSGWFGFFINRAFYSIWTNKNNDNYISAEEAFAFAKWRTSLYSVFMSFLTKQNCYMSPQMFDGYSGEFPLFEIGSSSKINILESFCISYTPPKPMNKPR